MANRYWVGGTGTWNTVLTTNWSLTSGGAAGASAPGTADTAIFDANSGTGNYTVTIIATAPTVGAIIITDPAGSGNTLTFAGTVGATVSGTGSTSTTFTFSSTTGSVSFGGTTALVLNGGVSISNSNLITFSKPITNSSTLNNTWSMNGAALSGAFNKTGVGTMTVTSAITSSSSFTQTTGTINFTDQTITCNNFSSSGSNTRQLTFGTTGSIVCTGSGLAFSVALTTGLTLSGDPKIYLTNNTTTAVTAGGPAGGGESLAFSFYVTGAANYALTLSNAIKNLDFTGFGGSLAAAARTIYGNLILSSGMTVTGTATVTTFSGSSGTKTITSNGTSLNCNTTFDGAGSTFKFLDAANNSGRAVILTNGIVDLNGQTVTYGSVTTAAGTKNITFNGGYLYLIGSVGFANSVPLGFTTTAGTANGFIYMAYALAKNFVGGGSSFAATLVQAAAGALTVSGSNTFLGGLTNTTQPAPIAFTSSTTNTFNGDIKLKGAAGKLIVITAVTAGTAATWSHTGSTVSCDYVSIKDNTAAGTVPFYTGAHSVIVSNATNWSNRPPPSANTDFLMFF
jgi:fibronectin-binding autotransporter adhesin